MESIIGKWKTGIDGHNIYEFNDNGTFRNYSNDTEFKLTGQYSVKKRLLRNHLLTISVPNISTNTLTFSVYGNILKLYPNDGGNPIVFERTH